MSEGLAARRRRDSLPRMIAGHPQLKLKVQLYCGDEIAMGPGKANLLEAIDAAGSISGGARRLGMSYRRAWQLVDTMNRCWAQPLVATVPGGSARSGAALTAQGRAVLASYRQLQQEVGQAAPGKAWQALAAGLRERPADPAISGRPASA